MAERQDWSTPVLEGVRWRMRAGRGGGVEFHFRCLPQVTQIWLLERHLVAPPPVALPNKHRRFAGATDKMRETAAYRFECLRLVEEAATTMPLTQAIIAVAQLKGFTRGSYYNWLNRVGDAPKSDWPTLLLSDFSQAGVKTAQFTWEAFEFFRDTYLSPSKPPYSACFEWTQRVAREKGWTLPSLATFVRRVEALPRPVRDLARKGEAGLKQLYPAQERQRDEFHAMEAVNADGHKFDVFVEWPDGTTGRPLMCAFQDLYSGKILSWRVDRTENQDAIRLAFADMVRDHGVPKHCWLDNGRAFASKWLTGGIPNRFRFKVREEEPVGILTLMGVTVHWTLPYSGQSKPIERAFRDLATYVSKHPACEGAYTGPNPMEKPENYGARAMPIADFLAVLDTEIVAHNAREGRESAVCHGTWSFDQVFNRSYASNTITRATEEQRAMLLLAAEQVRTHRETGSISLLGNRYWSADAATELLRMRGQSLVVRFDPEDLHAGVHAYTQDGRWLCHVGVLNKVGFADTAAGRDHARNRAAFMRATKDQSTAQRKLDAAAQAKLLAEAAPAPAVPPESRVVRLVRPASMGNALQKPVEDGFYVESEAEEAVFAGLRQFIPAHLRMPDTFVENEDDQ